MCGGRGTRLDLDREKPLVEIDGRPLVDRVVDALAASSIERCYAVTSPHAPRTRAHVTLPTIDAPGEGYVADLQYALERVEPPALTVAADLPLLDGKTVDSISNSFEGSSMTVCVPTESKRQYGVSNDTTIPDEPDIAPAGVNVIAESANDRRVVFENPRLAVNVNRVRDARIAQALLRSGVIP
ncbi:NTP transferase domain-containing protein [Halorhabdus amylolytica]|uniref:NTP transferase domain-containing protein n=1 Tax=Halorhabdus amylolytica TaxID=2559573 RepID=UPI00145B7DEF|nr:NTP transferase domain-containing protein [Halorhabdus amylolytica]